MPFVGMPFAPFQGKSLLPARQHENISGRISEKISGTPFKFRVFFFGNFVQQKGDDNDKQQTWGLGVGKKRS